MNRTVDHPGDAVVKTLTLSLDARESHGCGADYTQQQVKVYIKTQPPPIFDLSLLAVLATKCLPSNTGVILVIQRVIQEYAEVGSAKANRTAAM